MNLGNFNKMYFHLSIHMWPFYWKKWTQYWLQVKCNWHQMIMALNMIKNNNKEELVLSSSEKIQFYHKKDRKDDICTTLRILQLSWIERHSSSMSLVNKQNTECANFTLLLDIRATNQNIGMRHGLSAYWWCIKIFLLFFCCCLLVGLFPRRIWVWLLSTSTEFLWFVATHVSFTTVVAIFCGPFRIYSRFFCIRMQEFISFKHWKSN